MLLDTDVAVFDDPYKYFKHPPLQDIVVINQEESQVEANGGNLYVQVHKTWMHCTTRNAKVHSNCFLSHGIKHGEAAKFGEFALTSLAVVDTGSL